MCVDQRNKNFIKIQCLFFELMMTNINKEKKAFEKIINLKYFFFSNYGRILQRCFQKIKNNKINLIQNKKENNNDKTYEDGCVDNGKKREFIFNVDKIIKKNLSEFRKKN